MPIQFKSHPPPNNELHLKLSLSSLERLSAISFQSTVPKSTAARSLKPACFSFCICAVHQDIIQNKIEVNSFVLFAPVQQETMCK